MSTTAQIVANQANAKLSTGPKTEEGKAAASQNNFRHGLAGTFVIQSWEKEEEYFELLDGLRHEHQPITPTEILLVENMAKHFWLGQRALRLQEFCFQAEFPRVDSSFEKQFALYLRYQTTHERAFHKCLNDLQKLRAQQSRELAESNVRRRDHAAEVRRQEMHEARLEAVEAKTELVKAKTAASAPGAAAAVPYNTAERVREVLAADAAREAELQAYLRAA